MITHFKKIKSLELFAGSRSFSKVAEKNNFLTYSTDINNFENIDDVCDIDNFNLLKLINDFGVPDIIWASPPCTTFSIASVSHHWNKDKTPKTQAAFKGLQIIHETLSIIQIIKRFNKNIKFVIENPRGMLRKMGIIDNKLLNTVTYCTYGDKRMKPTDIWTNIKWIPRKMCKNGMPCHESAPRGSRSGTQGLKNDFERSKVPSELCQEIIESFLKEWQRTFNPLSFRE
tara:strand:- start:4562 stop:5248 length:687 start_codon:yes stop_codon:yes gene_type:complete